MSSASSKAASVGLAKRPGLRTKLLGFTDGRLLGYAFVAPALIGLGALILAPLVYSLVLSGYAWRLTEITLPKRFVGFTFYTQIPKDEVFREALRNTFVFVTSCVSIELCLGFLVALALLQMHRGRRLANAVILLPMIVTPVIVALIWRYLLDPQFGLVNYAIHVLGYKKDIGWLGTPALALPSVVLIDVWEWTPFSILVLHAGMLAIPEEMLEAARVDGAKYWQVVRHLILPYLTPVILVVLLIRTMDAYRVFDTIFVLTKGGPGLATETVGMYTYRSGFIYFDMGYAMALSIVILAIIIAISAFYLRLLRRRQ